MKKGNKADASTGSKKKQKEVSLMSSIDAVEAFMRDEKIKCTEVICASFRKILDDERTKHKIPDGDVPVLVEGKGEIRVKTDSLTGKNEVILCVSDEDAHKLSDPILKEQYTKGRKVRYLIEGCQMAIPEETQEGKKDQYSIFDHKKVKTYTFKKETIVNLNYNNEDETLVLKKGHEAMFNEATKEYKFEGMKFIITFDMMKKQHLDFEKNLVEKKEEKKEPEKKKDSVLTMKANKSFTCEQKIGDFKNFQVTKGDLFTFDPSTQMLKFIETKEQISKELLGAEIALSVFLEAKEKLGMKEDETLLDEVQ